MGVAKFHGVNYIDETKNTFVLNASEFFMGECCCFTYNNSNGPAVQCNNYYVTKYDDGKDYCYNHLRVMKRKLIKEKLLEKKAAEKAAKLAEKTEIKNQIALEKQKAKEEKQKANAELQKYNQKPKEKSAKKMKQPSLESGENVVINVCKQVLKSGPRKGETCGCKGKVCVEGTNDYYCARHSPNTNAT
jgi:hypothetical protein